MMTIDLDLINYVRTEIKIETEEEIEAFYNSVTNALNHAEIISTDELSIASGLFFLLTFLYYKIELEYLDPEHTAEKYKNNLLHWAKKYQITEVQNDSAGNAVINAKCIKDIFDKYISSTEQTIFMSRCFSSDYDENERAIRRVIKEINDEKHTAIKLIRVDQHAEGATAQISDRIFRDIEKAGLVIADLSSGRPNIPHEIGYAMGRVCRKMMAVETGLKKDLIIIHNGTDEQADEHTPSNIKMFEQIRFDGNYSKLENDLKTRIIDYYKL